MQRALGPGVALQLVVELCEDGAAERQVAQVILERREPGDGRTAYAKGENAVGDHLFGVWHHLENAAAQCLERAALRLLNTTQVLVNLLGGHCEAV